MKHELDQQVLKKWKEEGDLIRAYAYDKLDKKDLAFQNYEKALVSENTEIQESALFHLAGLAIKSNDYKVAEKTLKKLVIQHQNSEYLQEYFFWYGLTLNEMGSPQSIISLKQSLDSVNRGDDAHFLIAKIFV